MPEDVKVKHAAYRQTISVSKIAGLQHFRCPVLLQWLKNSHTHTHAHTVIPQSISSRAGFPPPQPGL